ASRSLHLPRDGEGRRRARARPGAALRSRGGTGVSVVAAEPSVREVLDKALDGERISEEDAVALLRSRDLVAVGRAADAVRNRLNDPSRVTFIVDRNLNYTNVCHTDCDFCAFYRRPGDRREGYLLPKAVIFKKIEETLGLGGTALLMQGGHHPDLGIEYYEDLFRSLTPSSRIQLHGFRAFISWTFQPEGTRLAPKVGRYPTSFDYLLTQAVSRIYLDNVDHIQSSWVTQGMKVGQVALGFGADDMGSVMIEENVVSAAGTTHRTTTDELVHLIRSFGRIPVQRDTLYREVKVFA